MPTLYPWHINNYNYIIQIHTHKPYGNEINVLSDFSRSDITVRGDYIILKDLHMLEQPVIRPPSTPTTPTTPTVAFPYMYSEGYQRQPPYNPNVY